jgi:undecaprenyl pyrophosphate phosphatase UppP
VVVATLITYWQAIVLGLLQGVSELFPISSLGHSVILPSLLGWDTWLLVVGTIPAGILGLLLEHRLRSVSPPRSRPRCS